MYTGVGGGSSVGWGGFDAHGCDRERSDILTSADATAQVWLFKILFTFQEKLLVYFYFWVMKDNKEEYLMLRVHI